MQAHKYVSSVLVATALLLGPSCSRTPTQANFATPDDAAKALLQAFKTHDRQLMERLFGREALEAVASGDQVSDRNDREVITVAMEQSWRWAPVGGNRQELIIGDEQWPFPVPLAKSGDRWRFDSEAGKNEVLARRIGRNELDVIALCQFYVEVQKEYAAQPHDGKPVGIFAQRIRSTAGRQDGLYWETSAGENPSPLGDLFADAAYEGYAPTQAEGSPFWGYRFRILNGQGESAPGGRKSYVVNGDMSGGFALVAYPAKYGSSGVMTFIVNQDGAIYEKDLGSSTAKEAAQMTEYNPDKTWAAVGTS